MPASSSSAISASTISSNDLFLYDDSPLARSCSAEPVWSMHIWYWEKARSTGSRSMTTTLVHGQMLFMREITMSLKKKSGQQHEGTDITAQYTCAANRKECSLQ